MKLETTVRLTREEIEKPVRLTLNDGYEIVILVDPETKPRKVVHHVKHTKGVGNG